MPEPDGDFNRRLRLTRSDVDALYELVDAGFAETRARFTHLEERVGRLEEQLAGEMQTVHATLATILKRLS